MVHFLFLHKPWLSHSLASSSQLIWEWLSLACPFLDEPYLAEPSWAKPSCGNTSQCFHDGHILFESDTQVAIILRSSAWKKDDLPCTGHVAYLWPTHCQWYSNSWRWCILNCACCWTASWPSYCRPSLWCCPPSWWRQASAFIKKTYILLFCAFLCFFMLFHAFQ